MTMAQRKAITNIIKAAEDSENYVLPRQNTEEENRVLAAFLKTLFKVENGEVKDFNDEVIAEYAVLRCRPKVDLL